MEDSVPLKSAHLLTDFLPVRDYYQNWNIQIMLTIIYWIFILHLTDFFDSYGMYLQDICPVVLNTTLQHEKKRKDYLQYIQDIKNVSIAFHFTWFLNHIAEDEILLSTAVHTIINHYFR